MPPAPTPIKPGGPKQMPKWAWPVAIGGGLLIGFFLLKKGPAEYEEEQEEESPYPDTKAKGGGGGGAAPFDPGILEAIGLLPPSNDFQGSGTGDGGFEGGDSMGGNGDGSQTSLAGQLPDNLFYNPTNPVGVGAPNVPSPGGGSTTPISQPGWGSLPTPSPAPAPPPNTGGGGNQGNIPQ